MSIFFDADTFASRTLRFNGIDYNFRPATIKDHIEYLSTDRAQKFDQAKTVAEKHGVLIETVRHFIPEIPANELEETSFNQMWAIYRFVIDGQPPAETEKNS